ncbi:DUF6918 family protein [Corynebacterium liangguodongii]|nr:hypothetical protein [Corynebacterium liangguodongii]
MSELSTLLGETVRPLAVNDLTDLARRTIESQSGLTGMALKSALGAATKANPEAVSKGIDSALPEIVKTLSPYWNDYDPQNSAGFGNYLASRQSEVVSSVLALGDKFAERAPGPARGVYSSLRGKAEKILAPVLPELGDILERHAI